MQMMFVLMVVPVITSVRLSRSRLGLYGAMMWMLMLVVPSLLVVI